MKRKPIYSKPMFFSVILEPLKTIAREFGYNLLLHGSLNRDMDLVLIPWVDNCNTADEVVEAFTKYLQGTIEVQINKELSRELINGAGRRSYIINLDRGGKFNYWLDREYYLDISVTPKIMNND